MSGPAERNAASAAACAEAASCRPTISASAAARRASVMRTTADKGVNIVHIWNCRELCLRETLV
jgi:hypothetical protein